jgi:hypothetical protein
LVFEKIRITELSVPGISKTSKNCRFSWKSGWFFDNWFFSGYLTFKMLASLELKAGITEIVFHRMGTAGDIPIYPV